MNSVQTKEVTRRIRKKVTRKLSSQTFPDGLSVASQTKSLPEAEQVVYKYNINPQELAQNLEKELSSSSSEKCESCWTPDKILELIEGLKLPFEVLIKVMQAIKATFSK